MTTKFSKWILYLSSYIPLYLIFVVSNLFDIYSSYITLNEKNLYNLNNLILVTKVNFFLIIFFICISIVSLILLMLILNVVGRSSEYMDFYEIKKNNKSINEYILVYILPFITVQTNDYKELTIFIIIFLLIGILSVKNDLVYINPILYIMKFNIYSFKETNDSLEESILISKYTILELKDIYNTDANRINARASRMAHGVFYIKKQN